MRKAGQECQGLGPLEKRNVNCADLRRVRTAVDKRQFSGLGKVVDEQMQIDGRQQTCVHSGAGSIGWLIIVYLIRSVSALRILS